MRPGVVWFGESLDPEVLRQSDEGLDCDLFLLIGTSSVVYPAAALGAQAASRGALTVEINPDTTPATTSVRLSLQGRAEEVLQELEERIRA